VRKALIVLAAFTAAALFAGHSSSNRRPRPLVLRGPAPPHSLLAFRHTGDSSAALYRVHALGAKFAVQENPRFYTIRDARSGSVLHRIKGAMPEPLVR